jgi:hypothetical protein
MRKLSMLIAVLGSGWFIYANASQPACKFDRNELRTQGWWWDVYECSDGTERRQIVVGPRS